MTELQGGILASVLQIAGYVAYLYYVVRREIVPNPISWFMFSYGMTLLVALEYDRDASTALLMLPMACAVSSMAVAVICWLRGGFSKSLDATDRMVFATDVVLTICYVATHTLLSAGFIAEEGKGLATLLILVCWNIGTFTTITPITRDVWKHPDHERPLPWVLWAAAYTVLSIITIRSAPDQTELWLYPILCAVVCVPIAYLATRKSARKTAA